MKTRITKLTLLVSIVAVAGMLVVPMAVNASTVEKSAQKSELSAAQDDSTQLVNEGKKKKPIKKK